MTTEDDINSLIAKRIYQLRRQMKMSRAELAQRTSVYDRKLSRYEKNSSKIPASFIVQFCKGLNISPSIFLSEIITEKNYTKEQLELLGLLKPEEVAVAVNFLKRERKDYGKD